MNSWSRRTAGAAGSPRSGQRGGLDLPLTALFHEGPFDGAGLLVVFGVPQLDLHGRRVAGDGRIALGPVTVLGVLALLGGGRGGALREPRRHVPRVAGRAAERAQDLLDGNVVRQVGRL